MTAAAPIVQRRAVARRHVAATAGVTLDGCQLPVFEHISGVVIARVARVARGRIALAGAVTGATGHDLIGLAHGVTGTAAVPGLQAELIGLMTLGAGGS